MATTQPINPSENVNSQRVHNHAAIQLEAKENKKKNNVDPLVAIFNLIYQSVTISNQMASVEAKQLQVNASIQDKLIKVEELVKFSSLSKAQLASKVLVEGSVSLWRKALHWVNDGTSAKELRPTIHTQPASQRNLSINQALQKMSVHNKVVSGTRSILEDQLNILKQGAQVTETNTSTTTSQSQQGVSQATSITSMLTALTNQISRI